MTTVQGCVGRRGGSPGRVGAGAALCLVLLLAARSGVAQGGGWQLISPDGGTVSSLAVDPVEPDTAYATTEVGLFKTVDAGGHWLRSDGNGMLLGVGPVVIDPAVHSTLYAVAGGSIYKSVDGGTTWQGGEPVAQNFATGPLVIDPQTTTTLYVVLDLQTLYKSTDGGATWTKSGTVVGGNNFATSLTIDPVHTSVLYAGTSTGGVFKSTDAGATWEPANAGMANSQVVALAVDPAEPNRIYASVSVPVRPLSRHILYVSTDGGATWAAQRVDAENPVVLCLAAPPGAPGTAYACTSEGLFKTQDGGATWLRIDAGSGMPLPGSLAAAPSQPNRLYAGAAQALTLGAPVYRTSSAGTAWTAAGSGLPLSAFSYAVDPSQPGTLYLSTYAGVLKSVDDGSAWALMDRGIKGGLAISLAIAASEPSTLFTTLLGESKGGTIAATHAAAARWSPVSTPFSASPRGPLIVDPEDADTLYSGGETKGGFYLFKSRDGGTSWTRLSGTRTPSPSVPGDLLAIAPSSPSTLYLVVNPETVPFSTQILTSLNGGLTFKATAQLPLPSILSLVVDPANANNVYLAGGDGPPQKSTDGGHTFTLLTAAGSQVYDLVFDPREPATLYAAGGGQVEVSRDGGQTWSLLSTGLPIIYPVDLRVGPSGTFYALDTAVLYRSAP